MYTEQLVGLGYSCAYKVGFCIRGIRLPRSVSGEVVSPRTLRIKLDHNMMQPGDGTFFWAVDTLDLQRVCHELGQDEEDEGCDGIENVVYGRYVSIEGCALMMLNQRISTEDGSTDVASLKEWFARALPWVERSIAVIHNSDYSDPVHVHCRYDSMDLVVGPNSDESWGSIMLRPPMRPLWLRGDGVGHRKEEEAQNAQ